MDNFYTHVLIEGVILVRGKIAKIVWWARKRLSIFRQICSGFFTTLLKIILEWFFNIEYLRKSSISGGPKIFLLWPKFVFHTKISFSDYTLGYPI